MVSLYNLIQGYSTILKSGSEVKKHMLNSAETETYPAHKCYNASSGWHFNFSRIIFWLLSSKNEISEKLGYFSYFSSLNFS